VSPRCRTGSRIGVPDSNYRVWFYLLWFNSGYRVAKIKSDTCGQPSPVWHRKRECPPGWISVRTGFIFICVEMCSFSVQDVNLLV